MSDADSTTPSPRLGRNGSSDGSSRAASACARRRASRSASSRYSSSADELKISRCSAVTACRIRDVDVAQRLGHALALGPGDQRRELEQLEVAHDRVRHVEVGVEAQLAQPPADAQRRLEQLVAQQPVGRVQRLGRPEQLLLALLPLGAQRRHAPPRPAAAASSTAPRSLSLGYASTSRRAGAGAVARRASGASAARAALLGRRAAAPLRAARRGSLRASGAASPACSPSTYTCSASSAPAASSATTCTSRDADELGLLLLAQPEVGDGGDRAGELARRGLGRAAHVGRRQLAEPRQRPQPLDDVGLRGEQLLAAQPEAVDQPVHVQVRAGGVDRRGRRPGTASGTRGSARGPRAAPAATRSRRPARRPCRACAGARSGCSGRCRPSAARSAGGPARARPPARRRGRPAAAATRARRGSRRAGRTPPRRPRGGAPRAPRAPRRPPGPRGRSPARAPRSRPGATPSRAISRSMSAATDCAWARSLAQLQNTTSPVARPPAGIDSSSDRRAARTTRRDSAGCASSRDHALGRALEAAIRSAPAPRKRRSAAIGSPAAVSPARRARAPAVAGAEVELLRVVDQHVLEALARRRAARAPRRSASRMRSPSSRAPASASIRSWVR